MTVTPQGSISLCQTPLNNDYKNQLTFGNITAQQNYFNGTVKRTVNDYTYLKQDSVIKVGIPIDDIIHYNYLFYNNKGFTSKRYYCFINRMEYINENCTAIYIETDCFQTWYFDLIYKPCFIEREHVNDDSIGAHTIPEGLETGSYITNSVSKNNDLTTKVFMVQTTEFANLPSTPEGRKPLSINVGGTPVAGTIYVCDTPLELTTIIDLIEVDTAVVNVYVAPKVFAPTIEEGSMLFKGLNSPLTLSQSLSKQTSLNGYTPKNKKLLTYPYNYLELSNNNGSANILQYELFSGNPSFKIYGAPTCGGSIICIPTNYSGISENWDEAVMLGKLPTCGWVNDNYTNWLTQQAKNLEVGINSAKMNLVSGGLNTLGNIASNTKNKDLLGMTTSTLDYANQSYQTVGSIMGSIYEHEKVPNSASGNTNGGDVISGSNNNTFFFYKKSIRQEYARIIDNYFSMYGYKVNTVKTPNITGRSNWNFVKTVDCNVEGNIPQDDLMTIRKMFDNGTTLWHNGSNMYNYNLSNNIV